jgi:sterol desaturase/sphingolipid hydroxylase (fatty acid hydroxylase superfamily)
METIIYVGFFGPLLTLALVEWIWPGSRYTVGRSWRWMLKGGLWFACSFAISTYIPLWVDGWLSAHALLDLSWLGLWGLIPAVLAYELLGYGYHRALHEIPALWRLHRTHHSSERIDMYSTFVFHPLDIAGWTLLSSVTAIGITGVSVEAAIASALLNNAVAALGHTNLRTPRWLGYIVARPENHALHHARGVHYYNFADFPIIDMMFGTFRSPETFPAEAGFRDGASDRIGGLLLGLDVTRAPEPDPAWSVPVPSSLDGTEHGR